MNNNISPHLFVAFRYLLGRAREGGRYLRGAAMGIAVSLVPIIVTLIVADGMIRGITDRYLELGTGHVRIYDFLKQGFDNIKPVVEVKDGVRGAWMEQDGMAVIAGKKGNAGATIRAVEESFWQDPGALKFLTVVDGQTEITVDNEALLGEALAQATGAEVGDTVRLMTVRITEDGRNIPRMMPFKVKGIVSAGYRELDALWCIVNYNAGRRIFADGLSSSFLMIKIANPYKDSDAFTDDLFPLLEPGYSAFTWKELQSSQYSSYESTRQILIFIMALIVVVAAVNISSATAMLALERRRDIAVLKACGTSPASIRRIFVSGAFLTGAIGAVVGISVGLLIGVSINQIVRALETILNLFTSIFNGDKVKILNPSYYLETIPIVVDWLAVSLIGLFTILCSVLASWLPSHKAGTLKPLEILRKY
ncbi:MAG: ABC transporter permease [Treponema sp.]|jgi:lipoprotein-releasing system permease protein|nr:ABC transporter permease [Treponema sp.]